MGKFFRNLFINIDLHTLPNILQTKNRDLRKIFEFFNVQWHYIYCCRHNVNFSLLIMTVDRFEAETM
jgi:hypothetical protein